MLIIRRAKLEDCPNIADVHSAAVKGISSGDYDPGELKAWAVPKDQGSYEDSVRNKEFFVAEDGDRILGFGVLSPTRAEIEAVYVDPNAGRRGVGLEIMARLEESARNLGLRSLTLNASLNAVPFYERAGFVAQPRSKYRLFTGVEIACIPMVKTLARDS